MSNSRPLESKFHLSPTYVSRYLSKYYILFWEGSHLLSQIGEAPSYNTRQYILHQGTIYLVKTKPYLPLRSDQRYKLSFRLEKFLPQGVVLVREVTPIPESSQSKDI